MKPINESDKLSLEFCRKILNEGGNNYTDEQILKIRNWLYKMTEITLGFLETKTEKEISELKKRIGRRKKDS